MDEQAAMKAVLARIERERIAKLQLDIEPMEADLYFDMRQIGRDADTSGHFWLAFADLDLNEHGALRKLIEQGFIDVLPDKRTHGDWRDRFPETHYKFTDKALKIMSEPSRYVKPITGDFYTDAP